LAHEKTPGFFVTSNGRILPTLVVVEY